jgi:hypothetical protein
MRIAVLIGSCALMVHGTIGLVHGVNGKTGLLARVRRS